MKAKCGYCLGDVTLEGVCVKNCPQGIRANQIASNDVWEPPKWTNSNFMSEWQELQQVERRRRVFEQFCYSCLSDSRSPSMDEWDWDIVDSNVELLLKRSDIFASKAQGEK